MVSIIVVNYFTDQFIYSWIDLVDEYLAEIEVIIVDNSETFKSSKLNVKVLRYGNIGYGRAINNGVLNSNYENILILNPDVTLSKLTLKQLMCQMNKSSTPDCITFNLKNEDGSLQNGHSRLLNRVDSNLHLSGLFKILGFERKRYTSLFDGMHIEQPLGGCFLISKNHFNSVNGFDSDFFVFWEDVDFFWRLREKAINPILVKNISITHKGGGSFKNIDIWKKMALEINGRLIYYQKRKWKKPPLFLRYFELFLRNIQYYGNSKDKFYYHYRKTLINWQNEI